MLYSFLRILMKVTVRIFFRSIVIRNKEVIPENGPLLVLANHPSTFMDPIVIATILNRKVYFLGKGELFKSKFAKWLLPKFNMVPVYRKQDDPSQMNKNAETFEKCFEHLENNGAILMFPEGVSFTERKLRTIKTGAARIVLGAEARNDFQLGVQIVNIGLNYSDPHHFNNDLFINIHKPIQVSDFKKEYTKDNFLGAQLLTAEITKQLEKLIIAIEDENTDVLVSHIEMLYKSRLVEERGIKEYEKDAEFLITKNILETVNYFSIHDRTLVEDMRMRIKNYFVKLIELRLSDTDIAPNKHQTSFFAFSFKSLALIVFGAPFWLYGFINNTLPFEIPAFCAGKISKQKEFRGAIGMVGGMFTFIIFYTIQITLVWKYTQSYYFTIAYSISLPISGLFAYWYFHTVKRIFAKWGIMMLFYKKSVYISKLITEREQIITEFDRAKEKYVLILKDSKLHPST